jgi:hypothetical protein
MTLERVRPALECLPECKAALERGQIDLVTTLSEQDGKERR